MQKFNATKLRKVFLISQRGDAPFAKFTEEFAKLFTKLESEVQFQIFPPIQSWSEWIQSIEVPSMLIVDQELIAAEQKDSWVKVFQAFRKVDAKLPIIVLSEQVPTGTEAMKWIDAGCSAFLNLSFKITELETQLQEMLARRIQQQPRYLRIESREEVRLNIASFDQALAAETLNLGQGGMFIRVLPSAGVKIGDQINFEFRLSPLIGSSDSSAATSDPLLNKLDATTDGSSISIQGLGRVAWIRPLANTEGPEGMGVQFLEIDKEGEKLILNFVARKKSKYFIPLS